MFLGNTACIMIEKTLHCMYEKLNSVYLYLICLFFSTWPTYGNDVICMINIK